jgi:hypothetical protein
MATASQTIANVVMPNLVKLKGSATVLSAMERRDATIFAQVFTQIGVPFTPHLVAKERNDLRIGVLTMPKAKEMGDAHLIAFVAKKTDAAYLRYFMLEHDYVLATKSDRTVICEREGSRTAKHGDGPPITGDEMADASAFIDAIVAIVDPPLTVTKK